MLVGNLENSWECDMCHYQSGICWEFVKCMQSGWEPTKKVSIGKIDSERIQAFSEK